MKRALVIFLQTDGFAAAFSALSLGLTAVASNADVLLVVGFDALRALVRGEFGWPRTERERAEAARAQGIGALAPQAMLREARELGLRVVACDTTARLCGFSAVELGPHAELIGLPAIWKHGSEGQIASF